MFNLKKGQTTKAQNIIMIIHPKPKPLGTTFYPGYACIKYLPDTTDNNIRLAVETAKLNSLFYPYITIERLVTFKTDKIVTDAINKAARDSRNLWRDN